MNFNHIAIKNLLLEIFFYFFITVGIVLSIFDINMGIKNIVEFYMIFFVIFFITLKRKILQNALPYIYFFSFYILFSFFYIVFLKKSI